MTTTTAQGNDHQWVNRETASAAEALYEIPSLYKIVTEMLHNVSNSGMFTDRLEGLMWVLWEGKTPGGENMKAIDWAQIASRLIEDNQMPENLLHNI